MGGEMEAARWIDGPGRLEEEVGDYAAEMGPAGSGLAVRRHATRDLGKLRAPY
jgi:hypothetical protein